MSGVANHLMQHHRPNSPAQGHISPARIERLRQHFSPQLAELVEAGVIPDPLVSHRREIVVIYIDLRGFTAFAETAEPDVLMAALRDYHAAIGDVVQKFSGTLERFTGDGMMIFFNDPVPIPDPALCALQATTTLQTAVQALSQKWLQHDIRLGVGIGISMGIATLGEVGYGERFDYAAIGGVTNLAARLCALATSGEVLLCQRVQAAVGAAVGASVATELIGPVKLKGFIQPQPVYRLHAGVVIHP
ncbi:MAG: adenylate/guanylate cyclase domain-containing protein [Betaproteobacteria bacterium]|nr:adenylate/guanylate cyclase domain-containing protein [Betaproteobacteria bacterium]